MDRKYGSDLCRLCLQKNDELVNIFCWDMSNGLVVAQIISDLFQVVVSRNDKYPNYICKKCYTKVMGFHRIKDKYPVRTLPSYVLFRNQCQIVYSAIDYAKRYNVSTPDFQHSPMSWDHSPFSLELEDLAAENELQARRVAVDNLLETVAQVLKVIGSKHSYLEGQLAELDDEDNKLPDMLALPNSSFEVDVGVFSSVTPTSLSSPITSDDDEAHSLVVDDPESSSPIRESPKGILRNRELKREKEEGGGQCSGDEVDVGKIKREDSPTSVPSPLLGRLPRKTKLKRVRYRESSTSSCSSEPGVRQPNNSERERTVSYDCAVRTQRHSSNKSLRSHVQRKHLLIEELNGYCQDSDDDWVPERIGRRQRRLSFVFRCQSVDQSLVMPGPSWGNGTECVRRDVCRKTFRRMDDLRGHLTGSPLGVGLTSSSADGDKNVKEEVKGVERGEKRKVREEKMLWMLLGVYGKGERGSKKPKTCIACGQHCVGLEDIRRHIMPDYRGMKKRGGTKGKKKQLQYKCCCCLRQFVHLHEISRHIQVTHSDARPFECKFCGIAFKLKKYLLKHEKLHTGVKEVKCKECGEYFWDQNLLKKHVVVHATVESYHCPECGKGFRGKHLLKAHQRIHNRKVFLKCPECPTTCATKSDLNKHMVRHSKIRSFECHICLNRYLYKRNLNKHMHSHRKGERMKVELWK